jgi:4-aminobutyrate--pyruvate transaminase
VRDGIAAQAHEFGTLGHGFTYGGHPVGAAVALETLAIYDEMDLPTHVARLSTVLDAALAPVRQLNAVGDVRIQGLLAGVELRDDTPLGDGFGKAVGAEAERRGIFFRIIGNVLAIAPPYICTEEELQRMGTVMAESIQTVSAA